MCMIYTLHIPPNGERAPKAEGIHNMIYHIADIQADKVCANRMLEPLHEGSGRNYTGDARARRPAKLSTDCDGEAAVTTIYAIILL